MRPHSTETDVDRDNFPCPNVTPKRLHGYPEVFRSFNRRQELHLFLESQLYEDYTPWINHPQDVRLFYMDGQAIVAWNLRRLRVLRELSQEKLAVDAGIDRTYVSRIERRLENPTVGVLDRLAKALSIDISEFFIRPTAGVPAPTPLSAGRRARKAPSK